MSSAATIATSALAVHPSAKGLPEWGEADPRFEALVLDIRANGVIQPLLVDGKGRVLDGRHRLRAARQLKLQRVPVKEVADDDVLGCIISAVTHRAHLTAGQRAYVVVPLLTDLLDSARARRGWNLPSSSADSPATGLSEPTIEDIANSYRVSRSMLFSAQQLHTLFDKRETLRAKYQPLIMREAAPMGLDHVLAEIHGRVKPKAKKPQKITTPAQFGTAVRSLAKAFYEWQLPATKRRQVLRQLQDMFAAMPERGRSLWKEAINNRPSSTPHPLT